jgi:hypothetical protein
MSRSISRITCSRKERINRDDDKSDYLAEGKKVVPAEVIASAYKKFVAPNNPSSVQGAHKGGKSKGKGKGRMLDRQYITGRWVNLYPAPEEINHDLLMVPHPDLVNRDGETYVIIGHNLKARVTKENWRTLRFNAKSLMRALNDTHAKSMIRASLACPGDTLGTITSLEMLRGFEHL